MPYVSPNRPTPPQPPPPIHGTMTSIIPVDHVESAQSHNSTPSLHSSIAPLVPPPQLSFSPNHHPTAGSPLPPLPRDSPTTFPSSSHMITSSSNINQSPPNQLSPSQYSSHPQASNYYTSSSPPLPQQRPPPPPVGPP